MASTPLQITLDAAYVDVAVGSTPTTGPFSFDFAFFSESSDIRVKRTDDVTGVVTELTYSTDFTVSGNSVTGGFQGGTITLVSSDSDATLTIFRDISIARTDWFPASGPFDITTLNQTLARIFAIAQEVNDSIDRGLKLDITEAGTELTLPALADRASKFLAFDASGDPIASDAVGAGTVVSTFAATMLDDASAAAVLTTLGVDSAKAQALGTASTKNTGVSNGQVPLMDATGYPAADGSQITNISHPLPRGYIDGLTLSNNTTDAAKDIDIAAGVARDGSDSANLELTSTLVKQIDATWAVGTNAGGLDTGAVAANTWYHVWLIRRSDTGVTDVLFSTSATAPTMPTSYDQKRRIGAVLTDATPDILAFFQDDSHFWWVDPILDADSNTQSTTAVLYVLSVPTGIKVKALFRVHTGDASATYTYLSSPSNTDSAPSELAAPLHHSRVLAAANSEGMPIMLLTDTSAQVRARASGALNEFQIATDGWIDPRGKNA